MHWLYLSSLRSWRSQSMRWTVFTGAILPHTAILSLALSLPSATSTKWRPWTLSPHWLRPPATQASTIPNDVQMNCCWPHVHQGGAFVVLYVADVRALLHLDVLTETLMWQKAGKDWPTDLVPFHFQVQKVHSPNLFKEICIWGSENC